MTPTTRKPAEPVLVEDLRPIRRDQPDQDQVMAALAQADTLVTMVIKGDGRASKSALELARTLHDLKRAGVRWDR